MNRGLKNTGTFLSCVASITDTRPSKNGPHGVLISFRQHKLQQPQGLLLLSQMSVETVFSMMMCSSTVQQKLIVKGDTHLALLYGSELLLTPSHYCCCWAEAPYVQIWSFKKKNLILVRSPHLLLFLSINNHIKMT